MTEFLSLHDAIAGMSSLQAVEGDLRNVRKLQATLVALEVEVAGAIGHGGVFLSVSVGHLHRDPLEPKAAFEWIHCVASEHVQGRLGVHGSR